MNELSSSEAPTLAILQQGNRHYRLDLTQKRVTFLDKRFYFTEDGKAVPSVTTILEAYPKGAAFFEWLKRAGEDADEIRDEAGKRGSKVHSLTEEYDKGEKVSLLTENGEIGMSMLEWSMFERYVQFRQFNPSLEVTEIEQNLISAELGYGGTKDRIFNMNGKRILLDIKTSSMVHAHYWLQLSAYKNAHNKALLDADPTGTLLKEGFIEEVSILWLNAKTRTDKRMPEGTLDNCQGKGWQFILRDQASQMRDWSLFLTTQKLWIAENENASPKEAVYQLEYRFDSDEQKAVAEASGLENVLKNGKGANGKK